MTFYLRLYTAYMSQQFKVLMEHRISFLIGAASTIFLQAAGILTIWVVLRQVPNLNGWSLNELLLVYGLLTLAKSIGHMFADNLWTIGRYIRLGQFDRFMVRPINPLFQLLADRFCHDGVGNFIVGLGLVGYTASALHLSWTPLTWCYLFVAVLSGGLIFIALNLLTCVSAFWIVDSVPVTRAVFEFSQFARYPLSIYPRAISILLTWLIPYGFAAFYPASYLVGRDIGWMAWLPPVVAVLLCLISYRVWEFGLRHYTSTGS